MILSNKRLQKLETRRNALVRMLFSPLDDDAYRAVARELLAIAAQIHGHQDALAAAEQAKAKAQLIYAGLA